VLVVTRYEVPVERGAAFLAEARAALEVLAARPGYLAGRIGRATDDPTLWVLSMQWVGVGAYRRALSAYEVKLHGVPLLARAIDEPTAYELLHADGEGAEHVDADGAARTRRAADADVVGVGDASAPIVRTDLDEERSPGR